MKKSEIRVLTRLDREKSQAELEEQLHVSRGYLSRALNSLLKKGLVKVRVKQKTKFYSLSENPLSVLIFEALRKNPKILEGRRETLLACLDNPKTLLELQTETGLSLKRISDYLKEFRSTGIVEKVGNKYKLIHEDVLNLVRLLKIKKGVVWERGKERLIESDKTENASLTAFSAFPKYGFKIFTDKFYYYYPKKDLSIEEVLVHALRFSKTKQQLMLVALFYLKNKYEISGSRLRALAKKYGVYNKLNRIFEFLSKKSNLFDRDEFAEKAKEYGIDFEASSSRKELTDFFNMLDRKLEKKIELYLTGGANMVLKNMKISTKDVDVIIERNFNELKEKLISLGFRCAGRVFEKENFRMDVFVKRVLNGYELSERMKRDAELFYSGSKLKVFLLSNSDVFLLKTYSAREGDLEDCKALAERGLDWDKILREALEQEEKTRKFLSLSLLDSLDELNRRYKIKAPVLKFLEKHCTRKMLKLVLKKEKTVKELVNLLQKPEPTIRKILREMEKEGKITRIKKGRVFKFKCID